jgi:hypothetical protein
MEMGTLVVVCECVVETCAESRELAVENDGTRALGI